MQPQQELVGIEELHGGRASVARLGAKGESSGISVRRQRMVANAPSVRVGVAVVDSGCDALVINKNFAVLHNIPMRRCTQAVQGLGGTPTAFRADILRGVLRIILGEGTPAEVSVTGRVLVEVPNDLFDILLGTRFVHAIGGIIDYWAQKMHFRSESRRDALLHSIPMCTLLTYDKSRDKASLACTILPNKHSTVTGQDERRERMDKHLQREQVKQQLSVL